MTGTSVTVINRKGRRISKIAAYLSSINRKQIPLGKEHHVIATKGQSLPEFDDNIIKMALQMRPPIEKKEIT